MKYHYEYNTYRPTYGRYVVIPYLASIIKCT